MVQVTLFGPRGGVKKFRRFRHLVEACEAMRDDRKQKKPRRVGAQLTEGQRAALETAKAKTGIKFSAIVRAALAQLGIK